METWKKPQQRVLLRLLLDRSGSMVGRETDVIGGVNKFIDEQKALPDPAIIALSRFDDIYETFVQPRELATAAHITAADFQPRGSTALLDAIGRMMREVDIEWRAHNIDRAICVIVTDGQENASREFNRARIRDMIRAREASGRWAFVYLGANVDAFAEAGALGISMQNSAGYTNTAKGSAAMYSTVSGSVSAMRASGSNMATGLGRNIGEDDPAATSYTQSIAPITPTATTTATAPDPAAATTWTPPVADAWQRGENATP